MLGHVRTCVRSAVVGRYGMATRPLSLLTDGLTTVELQNAFGKFPCVKLRGMPFNVTLHDIDDFLNGLRPIDIIIPKENPSGSVALLFSNARDADACMELDRKPIGSRYVDAIRIHRAEYYLMALESLCRDYGAEPDGVEAEMKGAPEGSILKMAGMPYEATYVDIQRFFPGKNALSLLFSTYAIDCDTNLIA